MSTREENLRYAEITPLASEKPIEIDYPLELTVTEPSIYGQKRSSLHKQVCFNINLYNVYSEHHNKLISKAYFHVFNTFSQIYKHIHHVLWLQNLLLIHAF